MNHGSLFSAIGGFDYAAQLMGWENAFHCEINPFGRQVLNYYWPNAISYEDITKTDFTVWRGRIDVLTGGFPCQPFSLAGKRKGKEDDRYLWPEMLRAIDEIRPRWVCGENVAGIVSMVQPEANRSTVESSSDFFGEEDSQVITEYQEYVIETVCNDLERIGYSVQPVVIPACAVGAPHRRDRIWFVANREDVRLQDAEKPYGRSEYEPIIGKGLRDSLDSTCGSRDASHATGKGLQIARQTGIRKHDTKVREGMDSGFKQFCRDVADTEIRGCRIRSSQDIGKTPRKEHAPCDQTEICPRTSCQFWCKFPTQSPVCGGNDGIPPGLVGITVPKHRNESIKAYGNAIVPQVALQIFKAIENYES